MRRPDAGVDIARAVELRQLLSLAFRRQGFTTLYMLYLRFGESWTYKEIADALGISASYVQQRLARAVQEARHRYEVFARDELPDELLADALQRAASVQAARAPERPARLPKVQQFCVWERCPRPRTPVTSGRMHMQCRVLKKSAAVKCGRTQARPAEQRTSL